MRGCVIYPRCGSVIMWVKGVWCFVGNSSNYANSVIVINNSSAASLEIVIHRDFSSDDDCDLLFLVYILWCIASLVQVVVLFRQGDFDFIGYVE